MRVHHPSISPSLRGEVGSGAGSLLAMEVVQMDLSQLGFGAPPLLSIIPGPEENEMQNTTVMGLVFPKGFSHGLVFPQECGKVSVLLWCQPAQSFGGKSVFFYCSSR